MSIVYDGKNTHYSELFKGKYGRTIYETREQYQKRFWQCIDKIEKDDHWVWLGSYINEQPIFTFCGITMKADILAQIWVKDIGKHGLRKYHYCLRSKCINPIHLLSNNEIQNVYNGLAFNELLEETKNEIKLLYQSKQYTTLQLATMFNVAQRVISQIIISGMIDLKKVYRVF